MSSTGPRTRLAVMLHADVVGSTTLVQRDERLAHQRIQACFRLLSERITAYGGTTHEIRGDALVAEFERASDAVSASLSFHAANDERNAAIEDAIKPGVRVGIAIGEMVIADGTVTGAGVVLAQRLEQLAEPGGIAISAAIREAIPGRLPFDYRSLGAQTLKGFDEPVAAYLVTSQTGAAVPAPEPLPSRSHAQRGAGAKWLKRPMVAVLVVGLAIVVAAGAWWHFGQPEHEPARAEKMAFELPDRPSIAVLPMDNLSADESQTYFADGMTEDLITDLSKVSGLFVIARNSTFAYKGKAVPIAQVAEELGVRYVLEGSVRRAGDKVRINAQLIDALDGGHVWAERYDGEVSDVFALQDKITQAIVEELSVQLLAGEERNIAYQDSNVPAARDAFYVGVSQYESRSLDALSKAKAAFERAVELDPDYSRAWALLAEIHFLASYRGFHRQLGLDFNDVPAMLAKALERPSPEAYDAQLHWLLRESRYDEMKTAIAKMAALDANYSDTYGWRALLALIEGDTAAGIRNFKLAVRLNPRRAIALGLLGEAYIQAGEFDEAVAVLERSLAMDPGDLRSLPVMTAAYALAGRLEEAKASAARLIAHRQELGYLVTIVGSFGRDLHRHADYNARLREGLARAGLPERVRAEDLNLRPQDRLVGDELAPKDGTRRSMGDLPEGRWMNDSFADGTRVQRWQGKVTGYADWRIENDEFVVVHRAPSTRGEERCAIYRNAAGSKETLDERVAVCGHGVYPYAIFPIPESDQPRN